MSESPPGSPDSMTSASTLSDSSEPTYSWIPTVFSTPDPDVFAASQKPAPLRVRKQKSQKFDINKTLSPTMLDARCHRELPLEVYDCILNHLRRMHEADPAQYQQDLRCRSRHSTIQIFLADLYSQRKWYGSKPKTRLKSIQRLLHSCSHYVRTIVVVDGHTLAAASSRASAELADTLASIVEQCPNLERLVGVALPYTHDRSRLLDALSSRARLVEHIWTVDCNKRVWNGKQLKAVNKHGIATLSTEQVDFFASMHNNWHMLQTLVLHGTASANMSNERLFFDSFPSLPVLRHLCISNFNAHDFNDTHLLSIPHKLRSLRLDNLPGLTQAGLAHFFTKSIPVAARGLLKSLVLFDLNLHSTSLITDVFAALYSLRRLAIRTAHLDLDTSSEPGLASPCLSHLHWELTSRQKDQQPLALNAVLASSIAEDSFPALRHVHCPHDPAGLLQAVCRPLRPLRPDQIPHDDTNNIALAAYSRAAQALGGGQGRSGADIAKGGHGVVRFRVWDMDLGAQVGSLEVPLCLGRVEGVRVPEYELWPWVRDAVADKGFVELRKLF
ncbi:hypothetical protein FH972_021704 [Carpinus fangiana]|uniref:Uncharacterized protein n=1 Tax=Carpinus fangiana TaxID=176857 RepID=A0A5N6KQP2_9ROSI|nr:hypothetical protein FH972_021704 [Carpinus fangiana]